MNGRYDLDENAEVIAEYAMNLDFNAKQWQRNPTDEVVEDLINRLMTLF